mmetsp:Transcript_14314/g.30587  ORF Transcript_14314/g.30587 Transcript_14314/m.30587 type:complete len:236 (+) Transcript_14314:79-786(+)
MEPEFVFMIANFTGLFGWALILLLLLSQSTTIFSTHTDVFFEMTDEASGRIPIIDQMLLLEVICFTEVGRIIMGQLRGNMILGLVLHLIRMACLLLVLPDGLTGEHDTNGFNNQKFLSVLILYSWSLTEVGRYPMYLFPNSKLARKVRMVLPLFTFPAGAAAEALGAYRVAREMVEIGVSGFYRPAYYYLVVGSLGMVVLINGVLGPTMAYPALLKKGLPMLLGKPERERGTKAD